MINITTYDNASPIPFNIEAKKMFINSRVELIKLSLKPAEEIELHKNKVDVVFYTVSGKGILTIENEIAEIRFQKPGRDLDQFRQ